MPVSALVRWASSLSPLSPPEEHREQNCRQQHCEIETPHDPREFVPVPSEKISDTGNNRHPDRCAQEIENCELPPGHVEHTSQGSGDDAHSRNEAGNKNREGAVALNQAFCPRDGAVNPRNLAVPLQQRFATVMSEKETEVIPNGRGKDSDQDDVGQAQTMLR